jgi:hypothetical protein
VVEDFGFFGKSPSLARVSDRSDDIVTLDAGHTIRFARIDFRNDGRVFGIKGEDRFLHVYVIGKTGTGKSRP